MDCDGKREAAWEGPEEGWEGNRSCAGLCRWAGPQVASSGCRGRWGGSEGVCARWVRESGASGRKEERQARWCLCTCPWQERPSPQGRGEQVWRGGQHTAAGDLCGCRHARATRAAILGPRCARLDPHARSTVSAGRSSVCTARAAWRSEESITHRDHAFSVQPGWSESMAEGPGRQHRHTEALFWNPVLGDKQVRRQEGRIPEEPSPGSGRAGSAAQGPEERSSGTCRDPPARGAAGCAGGQRTAERRGRVGLPTSLLQALLPGPRGPPQRDAQHAPCSRSCSSLASFLPLAGTWHHGVCFLHPGPGSPTSQPLSCSRPRAQLLERPHLGSAQFTFLNAWRQQFPAKGPLGVQVHRPQTDEPHWQTSHRQAAAPDTRGGKSMRLESCAQPRALQGRPGDTNFPHARVRTLTLKLLERTVKAKRKPSLGCKEQR